MINHYIIMSSSYSLGKRIALDYSAKDLFQMQEDIKFIIESCGNDVPLSAHFVQSESKQWDSVVKKDHFFSKVELVKTKEQFIKIISRDRSLIGLDIARYILTKIPCQHLKLQKLTYMCYADYLCKEKDKLFEDKIYAYHLGPVIDTVYKKYRKKGLQTLFYEYKIEKDKKIYDDNVKEMPIKSRILSSKDGINKLCSIDLTLEKYGNLSADELVKLTHKEHTPWTKAGAGEGINHEIQDDLIIAFHEYEAMNY